MGILTTLAVLFVFAAIISLVLSLLGVVVGAAFKLLPIVLVVLAVLFFVKGGKVHLEWPKNDDDDDDTIKVDDFEVK